jgi:hypothetical protein
MKHLLIALAFFTISKTGFSQQPKYLNMSKSLPSLFIWATRYPAIMRENCVMPFTYIKFKVSSDNKIDSLVITNNNSGEMKSELTRVIMLTEGHWNLAETKDQWFILPVIFHSDLNSGCNPKKTLDEQYKAQQFENTETNAVYFPLVLIEAITAR